MLMQLSDYGLPCHGLGSPRDAGATARGFSPLKEKSDVAGHAAREADDLGMQLVPERLQFLVVELIGILGEALKCARPLRIGNVDPSSAVAAEAARKGHNLYLMLPLLGGDADRVVDAIDRLRLNNS